MTVETALTIIAICTVLITTGILGVALVALRLLSKSHRLLEQVQLQTAPLIHDVTHITVDIRNIVKQVEKDIPKVSESLESIRGATSDIREFETLIRERVQQPLLNLTAVVAGVSKGLTIFWKVLSSKKKK